MRVTQVLYSGLGGHGSVVNSLVLADHEKRWEHRLIYYGIEKLLPAYQHFCQEQAIVYNYIPKRKGFFRLPGKAVFNAFRRQQPDCIILHSPTLIIPAWLYCLFYRRKLIVVEHTPHATKGSAEKIASVFSLLLARKVVCLSDHYRKEFQQQVPFLNIFKRTTVIRNGINLDVFSPRITKPNTGFHIGMAGRFSLQKNQRLITAVAIEGFRNGTWTNNLHIHFAGNGDQLEELQQWVVENNLEKQIHFHGLLEEKQLIGFFRSLDLYVHASFAETMCTSVMQAMACGLPVVGSDIPGINDLLPAASDFLTLLPDQEPAQWMNSIQEYYLREDLVRKRGEEAREAALHYFSAENTFAAYTKLIN